MDIKAKKKLLSAILISIGFMVFFISQVQWEHFSLIAERVAIENFLFAFLILFTANFIRTLRFNKIDHTGVGLGNWWIMTQVYNLMTATLPGGAGEAATAYLLKRFSSFNMLSALRILILTRIMDVTWLSALLFFAAMQIGETASYREVAASLSGIAFIVSIIVAHPKSERIIIKLLRKMPIKSRIMNRALERFEDVANISEQSLGGNIFGVTMLLSALSMIGVALSVHFVLISFGTGFTLVQSLYCFGVYALFQMVPVQGIAGIGTQAAWWSLSLKAVGYEVADTIALGIVLHGTFYMFIALMGLIAILFVPVIRKFG